MADSDPLRRLLRFLRRVWSGTGRRLRGRLVQWRDRLGSFRRPGSEKSPARFLDPVVPAPAEASAAARGLLEHRFDLLGSGTVVVAHGATYPGFLGHRYTAAGRPVLVGANRRASDRVAALIAPGYRPIDWQVDFRSGFRWSEALHGLRIPIGHIPGADIKVPWELGKLQHLVTLALARQAGPEHAGPEGPAAAELEAAFRNQVLDFVASNPPGFGVHWYPAMLPAIRGANLLIAYDLFRAAGARFDDGFESVLRSSVWEHGRRVVNHLEWWSLDARNNHYLADVAGLAVIAAHLPSTRASDAWLAFAASELSREVMHQFTPDGGAFEGSTAYHAFDLDAVAWGLSYARAALTGRARGEVRALPRSVRRRLARAVPPPAFEEVDERLARAARFLADTTPGGLLIQVGDNDSGRFVRPVPPRCGALDYADVREAIGTYLGWIGPGDGNIGPAGKLLRGLVARFRSVPVPELPAGDPPAGEPPTEPLQPGERWVHDPPAALDPMRRAIETGLESGNARVVEVALEPAGAWWVRAYPDFGLWVYGRADQRLTVRCGPARFRADGGHRHDDQLAVALSAGGCMLIDDPGSFVYTADPVLRNRFRGRSTHFVPELSGDAGPDPAPLGVWEAVPIEPADALAWGPGGFLGCVRRARGKVHRLVEVLPDGVRVTDYSVDAPVADPADGLRRLARRDGSAGYGILVRRPAGPD